MNIKKEIYALFVLFVILLISSACDQKKIESIEQKNISKLCPELNFTSIGLTPSSILPYSADLSISDKFIDYISGTYGAPGFTTTRFDLNLKTVEQKNRGYIVTKTKKGEEEYEWIFEKIVSGLKDDLESEYIKGTDKEKKIKSVIKCLEDNK